MLISSCVSSQCPESLGFCRRLRSASLSVYPVRRGFLKFELTFTFDFVIDLSVSEKTSDS